MTAAAYRTEAAFRRWVWESVAPARPALAAGQPALVAYPECIGMPLILTGAPAITRACRTWLQVGAVLTCVHLRAMRSHMRRYGVGWKQALLIALSRHHISRIYHEAFADLARELGATVVAGSTPMEGPEGRVFNTAAVFAPDGSLLGHQRKVHLTEPEGPSGLDLMSGTLEETRPFDTPAGRVGIAICLDCFDVDTSRGEPRPLASVAGRLAEQGAEILVQPSCNDQPWTADEAAGWHEGLYRRMQEHPCFTRGINPMMVGGVLDLRVEGASSIVAPGVRDDPPRWLARSASCRKADVLVVTGDR